MIKRSAVNIEITQEFLAIAEAKNGDVFIKTSGRLYIKHGDILTHIIDKFNISKYRHMNAFDDSIYMLLSRDQTMAVYKHYSNDIAGSAKHGWVLENHIKLLSYPFNSFPDSFVILRLFLHFFNQAIHYKEVQC